jgi:ABC-type nitrate/sulfonate/bicarbonate transport systems, periplasmic components
MWAMIKKLMSWTAALALMTGGAAAQDKASIRLDWIPTAAHAFVYLAKEKGFYAAENIDLDIIPGDGGATVIKLLGNGDIDFGFVDGGGLVRAWEVGIPITSIHLQFPETPTTIFVSKTSGITKPQDVCGRKFGVYMQSATYGQTKAMLKAAGVTCEMQEIPVTIPGTREFMSGAVDMIHTYNFNDPVFKLQGFEVIRFDVKDYFHLYSQVIVAGEKAMKRGDLVQRFVRASLKGLELNIKDPKAAIAALAAANKNISIEHEAAKMPMLIELMTVPGEGGRKIPVQTEAGWNETIDNLMKFGTIKKKVDPKGRFVNVTP